MTQLKEEVSLSNSNQLDTFKKKIKSNIFTLISNNQIQEAKGLISQYEEIVNIDIEIYHAKSLICIIEEEYETAEKYLKEAIHLDNLNSDTYYNLGYLYQINNDPAKSYYFYQLAKQYSKDSQIISEITEIQNELIKQNPTICNNISEKTNNSKKVLVIAHIFPPIGGSGVQRTLKFVKYMRNFGWEPIILTTGKSSYPLKDVSLLDDIPEGIKIIRIDEDYSINKQIISEIHSIINRFQIEPALFEMYRQYSLINIEGICIPDQYILWANKVMKEIKNYIDLSKIDLIYSTSGPYSDHIIGYLLKDEFDKPWVADFRDEWTNNPYANPDKDSWIYKMHFALEEKIVHVADKVINVTPVSTDNYREIFKLDDEKLVTITNGYDEDDFQEIVLSDKKNDKFTIIHNGLLYGIRNPKPILKAIKNLIDQNKIDRNRIKLSLSWCENAKEWSNYIVDLQLEDIVEFIGYVSHKESLQIAYRADILLLIVGPGEKNKAMYPGKLFEYLRLNKPILALSPKESVVDKLINNFGVGINIDFDDIDALEDAIAYFYKNWENSELSNLEITGKVEKFERRFLTKKLITIFNETIKHYSTGDVRHIVYSSMNEQKVVEQMYFSRFGKKIDLKNPKTFNEKLNWLKLNYRNPLMVKCADKVEVREYIKEKNLDSILIKVYGVFNSVNEIDIEKLPNKFVLKAAHGSGWNIICNNKHQVNWEVEFKKMNSWLQTNYYDLGKEWVYKDINPRIICEKFLEEDNGLPAKDYKIFCFNGEPKFIQVDLDRFGDHRQNIYDINWKRVSFEYNYPKSTIELEQPKNLESMLEIAKVLSEDFPFVRVDLYNVNETIYFGELTFFPHNGKGLFKPDEYDLIVGSLLDLNNL